MKTNKPGSKQEKTGKAAFNTFNDTEFANQAGSANKLNTANTAFNTQTKTEFAKQAGSEATGKNAVNTNKDLNS